METMINLPSVEAIMDFVNRVSDSKATVLVSKDGYGVQIDGASILGMMTVLGENVRIKCIGNAESLAGLFNRYNQLR